MGSYWLLVIFVLIFMNGVLYESNWRKLKVLLQTYPVSGLDITKEQSEQLQFSGFKRLYFDIRFMFFDLSYKGQKSALKKTINRVIFHNWVHLALFVFLLALFSVAI